MGIAAFVALVGFSRAFENEWLKIYDSAGTEITVVQKTFLNTSVDESVGDTLRALTVVERVVPMVLNMMDITPDVNAIVYGFPADSYELDSLVITQGRRFHGNEAELMLGEIMAETLVKKAGDTLEIQGAPFKVVGVFHGGSALETGGVLMPMAQLQKLADLGNKVTAFHIRLRPTPGKSADAFGARPSIIMKSVPALSTRTSYSTVTTWLDKQIFYPLKEEKAVKNTGVVKEYLFFGLRQSQGVWSATQIECKTRGKPGSSLLIISRGSEKAHLDDSAFNQSLLVKD